MPEGSSPTSVVNHYRSYIQYYDSLLKLYHVLLGVEYMINTDSTIGYETALRRKELNNEISNCYTPANEY